MATKYRIDLEVCVECGACVPECPLGAISESPYSINPDLCDACATCEGVCPTEAISPYEWTPPEPQQKTPDGLGLKLN